jgi:hypothetical protein
MRQVLFAVSLLTASASVALVAQTRWIPNAPGRWKPWMFNAYGDVRTAYGARPADVKAFEAHLLGLTAIIKQTDGFTNPIGFSPDTGGALGMASNRLSEVPGEPKLTARPLPGFLAFGAHGVFEYGTGASVKRDDTGERPGVYFYVNDLSLPLTTTTNHEVPEFEKLDVNVARLAPPESDVLGLPRYGPDSIVLKKIAAPIWAPVTLGETLELATRAIDERLTRERDDVARIQKGYDDIMDPKKREERIAQYKEIAAKMKNPAAYVAEMTKAEDMKQKMAGPQLLPELSRAKATVTKSEQDLAAATARAAGLSTADKAAPACYATSGPSLSRFRRSPDGGCDPLVRPNWGMFNKALPRSAPQVLIITGFSTCRFHNPAPEQVGACTANNKLLEKIDKAALMAWLQ